MSNERIVTEIATESGLDIGIETGYSGVAAADYRRADAASIAPEIPIAAQRIPPGVLRLSQQRIRVRM